MTHAIRYTLLIVDDEISILNTLKRQLRKSQFDVLLANSGKEALALLENNSVHLIISDMRMPEMTGAELLTEVKERYPETVRILLTGYSDMESTITAINSGGIYSYLTKPWNKEDLSELLDKAVKVYQTNKNKNKAIIKLDKENKKLSQVATSLHSKLLAMKKAVGRYNKKEVHEASFEQRNDQSILDAYDTAIEVFTNLIDLKMPGDNGINREIAQLAEFIGRLKGLDEQDIRTLRLAGMLHNVGQIGLSTEMLAKPYAVLDEEEKSLFHQYPVMGEQALLALEPLQDVVSLVREHKEYIDGSGFPCGKQGDELSLNVRILTLAVDFKAYVSGRMTGERMTEKQAAAFMESYRQRYDSDILDQLRQLTVGEDMPEAEIKMVSAHALQDGMRLAEDIYTESGLLVLSQGHQLTKMLISKLMNLEGRLRRSVAIYADAV